MEHGSYFTDDLVSTLSMISTIIPTCVFAKDYQILFIVNKIRCLC